MRPMCVDMRPVTAISEFRTVNECLSCLQAKCRIKRVDDLRRHTNILNDEDDDDDDDTMVFRQEQFDSQYAQLLREKLALEKVRK